MRPGQDDALWSFLGSINFRGNYYPHLQILNSSLQSSASFNSGLLRYSTYQRLSNGTLLLVFGPFVRQKKLLARIQNPTVRIEVGVVEINVIVDRGPCPHIRIRRRGSIGFPTQP